MREIGRRGSHSSFRIPHSAFRILVFSLAVLGPYARQGAAQSSDRFVDWSHQDAGRLIREEIPNMLLLGAGGAALVAGGSYVDEPVLNATQLVLDEENLFLKVTNELGSAWMIGAPVVAFGVAALADDEKMKDASFTSFQAILYAGAITRVLKETAGRSRPETGDGPQRFKPFSGNSSVPSGHATIAFALLTPWVHYYDHPASYALYGLAAGTAVSRIVRDKHWPTDVVTGGAIGFLMARYLSNRHLDEREHGYEPVVSMPLIAFRSNGLSVAVSAVAPLP